MRITMASLALAIAFPVATDATEMIPSEVVPDAVVRATRTPLPRVAGPAEDYARNCQGCHGHRGVSVTEVPPLRGRVGLFTHTPEGRAYLVQVPNVLQVALPDDRLANLMNWLLEEYSAPELAPGFERYTPEEVARLRTVRLDSVITRRREVVDALVRAGVIPGPDALGFSFAPGRY